MNIGKMDKRITLQKPDLIPDDGGGRKPSAAGKWVNVETVWAEFKKPEVRTLDVAGAVSSVCVREIKVRYRTDAVKGWRSLYGDKIMPIDHVYSIGTETFLVCKEVTK